MKLSLIITFGLILINSLAICQEIPELHINVFEDINLDSFQSPNRKIDQIDVDSSLGFILLAGENANVKGILLSNSAGNFVIKKAPTQRGTSNLFEIFKPHIESNNLVLVRLLQDINQPENYKTLTLKFINNSPVVVLSGLDLISQVLDAKCIDDNAEKAKSLCSKLNFENNFGENFKTYDENKVVYIIDYNLETQAKIIYKIYRVPASQSSNQVPKGSTYGLFIEIANFNIEHLSPNKHLQIKIININKFMYDVSTKYEFANYDSQPSALFSQFFLGDNNLLSNLMTLYANNLPEVASSFSSKVTGQSDGMLELLIKIKCFFEKYNSYKGMMIKAYDPCQTFNCCESFDYKSFVNELLYIKLRMSIVQGQINDAKEVLAKTTSDIDDCIKVLNDLETTIKKVKDLEAKLKLTDAEQKTLDDLKINQLALTKKKCPDEKLKELNELKSAQASRVKSFTAIAELLAKLPDEAAIAKMAVFIQNMVASSTFHIINVENIEGDRLDISIYIKSKDSLFKYVPIENVSDSVILHINVFYKPLISFSTGSFVAISNNLKNKIYDWQASPINRVVTDTSKYNLVESGYTQPVIGFSGLGNIEWKIGRSFGIGSSAGIGLTIEKIPRPSYLLGFSLFFGNMRQFVTTFGLIGMQVNTLKNNLLAASEQKIEYIGSSRPTIEYYKELKSSAFFSLTFTPFTIIKK